MSLETEDIIKGCKEGNRRCQDALVQKFAPGLLSLCMRYTSDKESAKDALQECFLNAFRYMHTYEGKGSFEGWLKRIAVTSSVTHQKKFRKIYFEDITEAATWSYAEVPEIYSKIGKEEIMELLSKLPQSLYLVFNLYVVEGYQHNEIAELLNITESTSRAALCKARNRLAELVRKQNGAVVAQAS
ncbi:MAG: sigma-70 family RNA polymerase sigma factor [Saprospiraceae bacterium]|nr:sigma-70 family RNA polymerase sigma factor [Saprospiraceae bacterium]MBL0024148.1 sigma-70 family RNA polymerase sigma factor [Saprospiraceae bacterium]